MWPFKKKEVRSEETEDKIFDKVIERQKKLQELLPKTKPVDPYGFEKVFEMFAQADQFKKRIVEDYVSNMPEGEEGDPVDAIGAEFIKGIFNRENAKHPTPRDHLEQTTPSLEDFGMKGPQNKQVSGDTIKVPLDMIIEKIPSQARNAIRNGSVSKDQARKFAKDLSDEDFEKVWQRLKP